MATNNNNSRGSDGATSADEANRSYKEELQRKETQLRKETDKNKQLTGELDRFKTLFEREKRQNEQYSRDIEAEIEKRDQQLDKREHEIFEMEEHRQRLLVQVENLKGEVSDWTQQNQTLAEQLRSCQKQLQDERNKTLPNPIANETALFEAEGKVEELRATIERLKADMNRLVNMNCELDDGAHQLQQDLAQSNAENESLRSLIKCQQSELKDAQDQCTQLQIQLHQLQSEDGQKEIAPRGNSLFAEVVDGKERLEKQLAYMHQQCRKLRLELSRANKLAFENAMSRTMVLDGQVLTGPTLAVFKMVKDEMEMRLNEKQQLLEKLHALEGAERRGMMKLAKESPLEFNLFQENIHTMTMREKQRLDNRVRRMELREQELLEALWYEKQRATSVPQLKQRMEQMERMVAHYEKTQLSSDIDKENE